MGESEGGLLVVFVRKMNKRKCRGTLTLTGQRGREGDILRECVVVSGVMCGSLKKNTIPFFFYQAGLLHLPSDKEQEETASEPNQEDLEKNFEVFYRADYEDTPEPSHCCLVTSQVSTSQEVANIPKAMVLEEKNA